MKNTKNYALEGLRGIAALVVVLSHAVFTFFPFLQTCDPGYLKQPWEQVAVQLPHTLFNGTFSVCIFFVMSGYVLSKAFFDGRPGSVQQAAIKRYIRLGIPVAASIMLGWLMMSTGLLKISVTDLPGFITQAYQGTASLRDAIKDSLWRSLINGTQTYNYVLWTIRIEFLGSLLLFAFLALFGNARHGWIYAPLAVFAIATFDPLNAPLYGLFFAGAYLNKAGQFGRNKYTHGGALLLGLFLGGISACAPAYQPLIQLILKDRLLPPDAWAYFPYASGAILVVWVAVGENAVSRFLSSKPLRWLGHKSFSLYLLHSFLLASVGMAVYTATEGMDLLARALLSTAAVLASSAAASVLFARYVDDASVRIANRYAEFAYPRSQPRTVTFGETFPAECK